MARRLSASQPCLHLAKGTPGAECGEEQKPSGSAKAQQHARIVYSIALLQAAKLSTVSARQAQTRTGLVTGPEASAELT